MNIKIVNLIAVKAFYEKENDFFESFSYFVLQVITEKSISVENIKKGVLDEFDLDIPIDVTKTLVKRLQKRNYIDYKNHNAINITLAGKEQIRKISEKILESKRETKSLLNNIKKFIKEQYDRNYNIEEIEKELRLFMKKNIDDASLILQGNVDNNADNSTLKEYIIKYFIHVQDEDPQNYEILKSLVYGNIISSVLKKNNLNEISKNFNELSVYLDTNIVFSLLGLHDEASNKSSQELLELMEESKFNLKIFSFTKDQIISVLRNYQPDNYASNIPIDTIYSELREKGYKKTSVIKFINNIDEELNKLGITVDCDYEKYNFTKINENEIDKLDSYRRIDKEIIKEIEERKDKSIKHDIKACEIIEKIRGDLKYSIKESVTIFLTADRKLFNYNFNEWGHKENATTITEIILKDFFVNLLWLMKPDMKSNLPIDNIIAGCKQKLLIDHYLWDEFIDFLQDAKEKESITQDEIGELISSEEIKNNLFGIQSGKIKKEKVFNIDEITKIKKRADKAAEKEIKNKNNKIELLEKEIERQDKELQKKDTKIKEGEKDTKYIEKSYDEHSKFVTNIKVYGCFIFFICLLIFINSFVEFYVKIEGIIYFVYFIFIAIIYIFISMIFEKDYIPENIKKSIPKMDFVKIKQKMRKKLFEKCIKEKTKKWF
ncbi:MAG: hypothetical protein KAQ87_00175 [Candidatus Pacebacteria bacterium]|nr:hypothetical protein [Candidatus Paceibacterota bacterium]